MKTVLLTGPSGSIGYQTLKNLVNSDKSFKIKVLDLKSVSTKRKLKAFRDKAEFIWGDIRDPELCKKAVSGVDYIIHTAALIPPAADEHPELADQVNFGGTKNLVDAVMSLDKNIFFVYTSSISVYGDRINDPQITVFDELAPSPGDQYALTKINAENYIKLHLPNFTVFRLSAVMDVHMTLDPLFFHMPLNTPLEIVTSPDVATALVNALNKQTYLNERIFNLGGGKECRIRYDQFLERNFKVFGLEKFDFPKHAFAEKNFHCAYYKDSHQLNSVLHFQNESLDDYLNRVAKNVHPVKKILTKIFRHVIIKSLLKRSEPYKAFISGNISDLKHFFHSKSISFSKI